MEKLAISLLIIFVTLFQYDSKQLFTNFVFMLVKNISFCSLLITISIILLSVFLHFHELEGF